MTLLSHLATLYKLSNKQKYNTHEKFNIVCTLLYLPPVLYVHYRYQDGINLPLPVRYGAAKYYANVGRSEDLQQVVEERVAPSTAAAPASPRLICAARSLAPTAAPAPDAQKPQGARVDGHADDRRGHHQVAKRSQMHLTFLFPIWERSNANLSWQRGLSLSPFCRA